MVRLALDTGATATVIAWEALVLLGYDPGSVENRTSITTASAIEFVPQVMVERIRALGVERRDFPILCHTFPPSMTLDGVLGLDFFRGKRLVIDFRTGELALQSQRKRSR